MILNKDFKKSLDKNKILLAVLIVAIILGLLGVIFKLYNTQQLKKTGLLDSAQVVTNFYSWYSTYAKNNDVLTDRGYKDSIYLSAEAVNKINKVIDSFGGGGGYDPIWCSHKAPDSYTVEVDASKDNSFLVKKVYAGQLLDHQIIVKKVGNIWQIDNIICEKF